MRRWFRGHLFTVCAVLSAVFVVLMVVLAIRTTDPTDWLFALVLAVGATFQCLTAWRQEHRGR